MNPPSIKKRVAVFDLGSNSIKFLAADVLVNNFTVITSKHSITRLGEGIQQAGVLSEAAMERTLDAIAEVKTEFDSLQISEWKAVATSAVRSASNGKEFQKKFRDRMHIDLQILSGEEEAELIYRGVTSDAGFVSQSDPLLVIDSGGGSSEFIKGTSSQIEKRISLDLGCVRMTERFLKGNPYSQNSFEDLMKFYRSQIEPLKSNFDAKGRVLIGTGGSISTAAAILKKFPFKDDKGDVHGMKINLEQLESILEILRSITNDERIRQYDLPVNRADVIVAGIAFFLSALSILGFQTLRVSL